MHCYLTLWRLLLTTLKLLKCFSLRVYWNKTSNFHLWTLSTISFRLLRSLVPFELFRNRFCSNFGKSLNFMFSFRIKRNNFKVSSKVVKKISIWERISLIFNNVKIWFLRSKNQKWKENIKGNLHYKSVLTLCDLMRSLCANFVRSKNNLHTNAERLNQK